MSSAASTAAPDAASEQADPVTPVREVVADAASEQDLLWADLVTHFREVVVPLVSPDNAELSDAFRALDEKLGKLSSTMDVKRDRIKEMEAELAELVSLKETIGELKSENERLENALADLQSLPARMVATSSPSGRSRNNSGSDSGSDFGVGEGGDSRRVEQRDQQDDDDDNDDDDDDDDLAGLFGSDEEAGLEGRSHVKEEGGRCSFESKHFKKPTKCAQCQKSILGLTKEQQKGRMCSYCGETIHSRCEEERLQHPCEMQVTVDLQTPDFGDRRKAGDVVYCNFVEKYFSKPTMCCLCRTPVMGVTLEQQRGKKCTRCKDTIHAKCEQGRCSCRQVPRRKDISFAEWG